MHKRTIVYISTQEYGFSELAQDLQQDGVQFYPVHTGNRISTVLEEVGPQLIVYNCQEQTVQNLTLCQEIRRITSAPLILVCETKNQEFNLLALKLGADLTLPPMGNDLFRATLHNLLNRFSGRQDYSPLVFGPLIIDPGNRDAQQDGSPLQLSGIEFDVLWLLASKARQVVSRDEIHQELYQRSYNGYDRSIDLYIYRIRRKLLDDPHDPQYIKTVRGTGYQFIASKVPGESLLQTVTK